MDQLTFHHFPEYYMPKLIDNGSVQVFSSIHTECRPVYKAKGETTTIKNTCIRLQSPLNTVSRGYHKAEYRIGKVSKASSSAGSYNRRRACLEL